MGYDILGEPSPVPIAALCPAEKLQWNISPETAEDIQIAKKNHHEYVNSKLYAKINNITCILNACVCCVSSMGYPIKGNCLFWIHCSPHFLECYL